MGSRVQEREQGVKGSGKGTRGQGFRKGNKGSRVQEREQGVKDLGGQAIFCSGGCLHGYLGMGLT